MKNSSLNEPIVRYRSLKVSLVAVGIACMITTSAGAQTNEQASETARIAPSADANRTSLPGLDASRVSQPSITSPRTAPPPRPAALVRQPKTGLDEKGAFATYVETVTGKPLDIFGRDLFSDVPSTFAPLNASQVNPDYVIGTGDELQIRGWGMVDIDVGATVDRGGSIYIPRVGAVKVSGVSYRDLQGHLKKAVGKFFNNFELTVSISQTRAVQVYVVGHAVRPGSYTLSAMSTLLNALFESGGPSTSGSMRNIQVKRGAETVTSFDLYDMLSKGDKTRDLTLRDGDVIFIPEVGPLVALTGNVKRPAVFELKGANTLSDIIEFAGGFDSAAETKPLVVEKNVNNKYEAVLNIVAGTSAANTALAAIPVQPTDIYRVFSPEATPVEAQIQVEYVRVSGEVERTGVIAITKGETLRQLIHRLGGSTPNGYLFAMQVKRDSIRRVQQVKLNEIADRFERDLETNAAQRLTSTTDKDNIAAVTAELERQRVLAQKMRSIQAEGRVVLELKDARAQVKDLPDLPLQDGDTIFLPRKPGTVNVLGAVFQPNTFIYQPNRTVNDFLELAGGLSPTSEKSDTYVIRADGTAISRSTQGWFGGLGGSVLNPGDTIVVPERLTRESWTQNLKEWTAIFYQFGLGAAGLKVLQN